MAGRLRDTNHFVLLPGEMWGIFIPHNIGTYWAGAGVTWSDDTQSSQLSFVFQYFVMILLDKKANSAGQLL